MTRTEKVVYWICAALFVLNDVLYICIQSSLWTYAADYAFRVVIIAILFVAYRPLLKGREQIATYFFLKLPRETTERDRVLRIVIWAIVASVAGYAVERWVQPPLRLRLIGTVLFRYPVLAGPLKIFDITVGVGLIVVPEEAVFRVIAVRMLFKGAQLRAAIGRRFKLRSNLRNESGSYRAVRVITVVASCLVFGAAHWSHGIDAIISTAIWGIVPMIALVQTGSIWPALIAHFITDFLVFGGFM